MRVGSLSRQSCTVFKTGTPEILGEGRERAVTAPGLGTVPTGLGPGQSRAESPPPTPRLPPGWTG